METCLHLGGFFETKAIIGVRDYSRDSLLHPLFGFPLADNVSVRVRVLECVMGPAFETTLFSSGGFDGC